MLGRDQPSVLECVTLCPGSQLHSLETRYSYKDGTHFQKYLLSMYLFYTL